MKRSEINWLIVSARRCFDNGGWTLPPNPRWDVTDFGKGRYSEFGLVLINLCEEPEYCEKLMYAKSGMKTPAHAHRVKKEDIVSRRGSFRIELSLHPEILMPTAPWVKVDGQTHPVQDGLEFVIEAGSRITLLPGVFHCFEPLSEECIFGEVSTANDDLHDNVFLDAEVGRFSTIEEDEPALLRLLSEASLHP
jgi:D-lyxose ketol-isomerase